ncbi:MAG: segregation and condensation protein A [Bacillota bacterium]
MDYQIHLDIFTGPFDLLLHLIDKHEIDILDIPIARITEEYLLHLQNMDSLNVEQAGEFLVMAATLMQIKAKMLVPEAAESAEGEQEQEDPRQELVRKLLEYKLYKDLSMMLKSREAEQQNLYFRTGGIFWDTEPGNAPSPLTGVALPDLLQAFLNVLESLNQVNMMHVLIPKKGKSIRERMKEIMDKITKRAKLYFHEMMDQPLTKEGVITYFLAMLELLRLRRIFVIQQGIFGAIAMMLPPGEVDKRESDSGPGDN